MPYDGMFCFSATDGRGWCSKNAKKIVQDGWWTNSSMCYRVPFYLVVNPIFGTPVTRNFHCTVETRGGYKVWPLADFEVGKLNKYKKRKWGPLKMQWAISGEFWNFGVGRDPRFVIAPLETFWIRPWWKHPSRLENPGVVVYFYIFTL